MKKILLVDDSAFMRGILKEIILDASNKSLLKDMIEIHEADGKPNGLKQVQAIKPDVILLDVVMQDSEVEGLEFIEEIKDKMMPKKIIVISSIGQKNVIDRCNELGVACYLQKPFEQKEVIDAINKVIKK